MACFEDWQTRHAGLFTFANSEKHVGLYQRFGFWADHLTAIMSKAVHGPRGAIDAVRCSRLPDPVLAPAAKSHPLPWRLRPILTHAPRDRADADQMLAGEESPTTQPLHRLTVSRTPQNLLPKQPMHPLHRAVIEARVRDRHHPLPALRRAASRDCRCHRSGAHPQDPRPRQQPSTTAPAASARRVTPDPTRSVRRAMKASGNRPACAHHPFRVSGNDPMAREPFDRFVRSPQ
jgi:hypothetical protein